MFKRVFDMENPVMRAMGVTADLLVLNALTLLCSLPVVTAGAAYTALNAVMLRIVRGEEPYIARTYFQAFRRNLKQGSALGMIFLLAAAVLAVDAWAAAVYAPPLRIVAAAAGTLLLGVALYAFALLARYENTLLATLKNAAALLIGFFPRTAGMLASTVGLWLLAVRFVHYALPLMLMLGLSLPCYLCALLYDPVFQSIEQ